MATLVIGRDALLLLGDDVALLLGADADLDEGLLDILLADKLPVCPCRADGGLVQKVLEIRAGEARRRPCDLIELHVIAKGLVPRMDLQDGFPSPDIREGDRNLAVKAAGAQDGRIEDVGAVCRRHHDNALVDAEAVHLDKELVQRLLSLVVAAAKAGSSSSRHRIDLIDEDDAGGVLLRLVKHVADTGGADTDEHLHEVRAGDRVERHAGFAGHRLGKQGLAGAGASLEQHALGDSCANARIPRGILQEVDDLLQVLLLLVEARDIRKGDRILVI